MKSLPLVLLLMASAACSKSEKKADPAPAAPPTPAEAAPPPVDAAVADPAAREPGQYKMEKPARTETTSFARFDDAVAGKAPWLTDAEIAAGVVEYTDIGKKPSIKRLCKADAKAALEKYGAILVKRIKDTTYGQPACVATEANSGDDSTTCIAGRGPDEEPSVLLDYRKSNDGWTLSAIQYTDGDGDFRPVWKKYEAQIKSPCK